MIFSKKFCIGSLKGSERISKFFQTLFKLYFGVTVLPTLGNSWKRFGLAPKPLLLLTYLSLEGQQSRSHIADLFWPHARVPRNSLSSALSQIRRFDRNLLSVSQESISTSLVTDLERILSQLKHEANASPGMLRQTFLNDLNLSKGEYELEEWLYQIREDVNYASSLFTLGMFEKSQNVLEGANPYILLGLRERLAKDSSGPFKPLLKPNVPFYSNEMLGRQIELNRLKEWFAEGSDRALCLTGVGGIGKTRLASAFARSLKDVDVAFLSFGTQGSGEVGRASVLKALRIEAIWSEFVSSPANYLKDLEPTLLVLDDVGNKVLEDNFLHALLQGSNKLRLLLTRRSAPEGNLHIEPITGLNYETSTGISDADALLLNRYEARGGRLYSATNLSGLSARVAGMPLALELLGSLLLVRPPSEALEVIQHPNSKAQGSTLEQLYDSTWNDLTAREQDIVMRLSIFPKDFSIESGISVCDATFETYTDLVQKSLLRPLPNKRFSLHPVFREYFLNKLKSNLAALTKTQERFTNYFYDLILKCKPFVDNDADAVDKLQDELTNVVHLWSLLEKNFMVDKMRLTIPTLRVFFANSVQQDVGLNLIHAPGTFNREIQSQRACLQVISANRSILYKAIGDHDSALSELEAALELLDAEGLGYLEKHTTLNSAGITYWNKNDLEKAELFYRRALELSEVEAEPRGIAALQVNLSILLSERGKLEAALHTVDKAIALLHSSAQSRHILCLALLNKANYLNAMGNFEKAALHALKGLKLAEAANFMLDKPYVQNVLTASYLGANLLTKARNTAQRALESANTARVTDAALVARCDLARLDLIEGRPEGCLSMLRSVSAEILHIDESELDTLLVTWAEYLKEVDNAGFEDLISVLIFNPPRSVYERSRLEKLFGSLVRVEHKVDNTRGESLKTALLKVMACI